MARRVLPSWVLQSLKRPRRVCGNRSSVRQSTSCFTPPTFIRTRLLSALERIIINGSGGSDDIDLLSVRGVCKTALDSSFYVLTWNVCFAAVLGIIDYCKIRLSEMWLREIGHRARCSRPGLRPRLHHP